MPIQHDTYAVPRMDLGVAFHEYEPENDGFIATKVFPVMPAAKKAGTMSVVTRENLKRADSKHSNGSAYNRINLITEDKAYACENYGLEIQVTDEDRENYVDDYDSELESSQALAKKIFNELEIRVKTIVFNTTTFTGSALFTDNKASPWSTVGTNIFTQIAAAKEKVRANTGVKPDALIIGEESLNNMLKNTGVIARFPGAQVVTEEMIRNNLASLFGLKELLVGGSVYDSAKEGQDFVGADIWPKHYASVAKIQRGPTKVNPGIGRTIIWERMMGNENMAPVEQYREEQTKSDILRIEQYLDELLFDKYFAHLMQIETT